jgi:Short repeat of unknown function (DUF308)
VPDNLTPVKERRRASPSGSGEIILQWVPMVGRRWGDCAFERALGPVVGTTAVREDSRKGQRSLDKSMVSRIWWAVVLRGILAILFGVVALFYTGSTLLALVYVFGIYAVLNGLFAIVAAVRTGEAHRRWDWPASSAWWLAS